MNGIQERSAYHAAVSPSASGPLPSSTQYSA